MNDRRFIEKRVKINSKLLNSILVDIKDYHKLTGVSLANKLGISEHSIRHGWLRKGNTIPSSIFKKLMVLHPTWDYRKIKEKITILEPFWGQKIGVKSKIERLVKLPDHNKKEFAEFYGIMLGDGCIYSNLSGFCISSNSVLDKEYIESYVSKLILNLFGIKPKIYYSKQAKAIRCVIYSKKIANYLISFGFPKGKKIKGNLIIPELFFENPKLLNYCIRGIVDTDGSVCPHPNTKIMLSISILSKPLLKSCIRALNKTKIYFGYYNKGINMYGSDKLNNYFKLIGSSNPKNILKYQTFVNMGYTPFTLEIENLLSRRDLRKKKL